MMDSADGNGLGLVYGWVRRTRVTLLSFLSGIPWEAVTREHPDVGHGSVRGILLHAAASSRYWLEGFAMGRFVQRPDEETCGMDGIQSEFSVVDALMADFLRDHERSPDAPMTRPLSTGQPFTASPRWLFTHVTTHEFHHKGQAVMLCRRMGHPPVETDLWSPWWGRE